MATDMGGFAQAGGGVLVDRFGRPLQASAALNYRRDDLIASGGETIVKLTSPAKELRLYKNTTLLKMSEYTVNSPVQCTLGAALSMGDVLTVEYKSAYLTSQSSVVNISTDPYFSSVVALLHMDGSNGGTTFTDQKGATWTTGGVTTSTSSPKFGTASALFIANSGSYLKTTHTTSWDWGANDFTIEAWVRQTTSDANYHGIFVCDDTAATRGLLLLLSQTTGYLSFSAFTGSTSHPISDSVALTINTWYHVAAVRDGSNLRLYKNGVQVGSAAISGALNTVTHPAVIGTLWDSGAANTSTTFNGNIDDFRVTNGVCRYPGGTTFSVPTAAFPDS